MTRFLEFLISLVIVAVLFLVVGVFLPSHRDVQHSVETNHPVRQVYDTLNSFKRFGEWNALRMHDPSIRFTLEGPERGPGAKLRYESNNPRIGTGTWEIVNAEEDSQIEYAITNDAYGENKTMLITLDQQGKTVQITQEYDVEYGWSLLGRYAGLYVNRTVGDDIKLGLNNMVGLLATMPNFDYSSIDVHMVPVQPQNVLYISTSSDRNITAVENTMIVALKDLRAAIASNRLEAAGPPRLITTNFGAEKYEFDVAIPVRRPTPGDDAEEEVADDAMDDAGEDADATIDTGAMAAAEPVDMTIEPAPAPLENLNLPANILPGTSYAGKALKTEYMGHPAALPLIRDMLRSYAAAHGLSVHDRSFEEYLTEIEETSPEEARFKVYWPIQ